MIKCRHLHILMVFCQLCKWLCELVQSTWSSCPLWCSFSSRPPRGCAGPGTGTQLPFNLQLDLDQLILKLFKLLLEMEQLLSKLDQLLLKLYQLLLIWFSSGMHMQVWGRARGADAAKYCPCQLINRWFGLIAANIHSWYLIIPEFERSNRPPPLSS